jgi:cellulose synthase/poly-beta-1,6-N-acetylglucosamine synthase-like glycosyltransferase
LLPAHDEEATLAAALDSLAAQTRPPDRTVVVADNCTDNTALLAYAAGVEVFVTVGNSARKAGALNQALARLQLDSETYVLAMDADTVLCDTWIEDAVAALVALPDLGAVSGTYRARSGRGAIALLQKIEYHQVHRRISRGGGHVYVLSGTATMFSPAVLRSLDVGEGRMYDETSIVEDFDVTLRVRFAGYRPRTFKHLVTTTDVMETWRDLSRQRLRWQRGTLETLLRYGWRRHTRRLWLGQVASYLMTLVFLAMLAAWGYTIHAGIAPDLKWLLIIPVFVVSQLVETRRAGVRATLLAMALVPLWLYDLYRLCIYWIAAGRVVLRTQTVWH